MSTLLNVEASSSRLTEHVLVNTTYPGALVGSVQKINWWCESRLSDKVRGPCSVDKSENRTTEPEHGTGSTQLTQL